MTLYCKSLSILLAAASIATQPSRVAAVETPEFYVADFSVTQPVSGLNIKFPGKLYIGADFSIDSAPVIRVHAIVDLSDLQAQVPALVAKAPLPKENCASYSLKNPVVSLSNSSLNYNSGRAIFHTDGSAVVWTCLQNPVPCTKVEWQMKDLGIMKTKVPVVQSYACNPPIKTIDGTQPFSIDAPFTIKVDNTKALQLVPGNAAINLSGQYVGITKNILETFSINLDAVLTDAIRKALDAKKATAALPPEFIAAGLTFESAQFVSIVDHAMGVDVRAKLNVTTATVKEMGKLLYAEAKKRL